MLSRKHYKAIAEIIDNASIGPDYHAASRLANDHTREYIANKLATYFASDNPNFDRKRFLDAAGVSDIGI